MIINLNSWETQLVPEAVRTPDGKLNAIIDDEDIQSEYGNDLTQQQLVQKRIEQAACLEFGPKVNQFSRVPVGVAPEG